VEILWIIHSQVSWFAWLGDTRRFGQEHGSRSPVEGDAFTATLPARFSAWPGRPMASAWLLQARIRWCRSRTLAVARDCWLIAAIQTPWTA